MFPYFATVKICLNLFQTFSNMKSLSWIYVFAGHPIASTVVFLGKGETFGCKTFIQTLLT